MRTVRWNGFGVVKRGSGWDSIEVNDRPKRAAGGPGHVTEDGEGSSRWGERSGAHTPFRLTTQWSRPQERRRLANHDRRRLRANSSAKRHRWSVHMLWRERQLCRPEPVLSGGHAHTIQVAESSQSAAELQLDRLSGTAPTLPGRTTTYRRAAETENGSFGGLADCGSEYDWGARCGKTMPWAKSKGCTPGLSWAGALNVVKGQSKESVRGEAGNCSLYRDGVPDWAQEQTTIGVCSAVTIWMGWKESGS